MKKNVVIIILSVVMLGLGGYLVYDKVIDKNDKKTPEDECVIKDDNNKKTIVSDLVNGKVIQTYVHNGEGAFELQENEVPYVKATIPYINIETEEAKELNKKIQENYKDVINVIENNINEQINNKGPYYKIVNYNYTIRDNILFVFVESTNVSYRASGGVSSNAYYYDIENDKILNTNEVLEKLGKTKEQVLGNLNLTFEDKREEIANDLDNNISIFIVGNSIFIIPTSPYTFNTFQI